MDTDSRYTLWQRVGGHWVIERSYEGAHIKGYPTYAAEIAEKATTTRPVAFFKEGVDPNSEKAPASKPVAAKTKETTLTGRAKEDFDSHLPIAKKNVAQKTTDRQKATALGSVVDGIHPDAGAQIVREVAKEHPGILDQVSRLPLAVQNSLKVQPEEKAPTTKAPTKAPRGVPTGWKSTPTEGTYDVYEAPSGNVRVQDTKKAGSSRYQVIYKDPDSGEWLELSGASSRKKAFESAQKAGVGTEAPSKPKAPTSQPTSVWANPAAEPIHKFTSTHLYYRKLKDHDKKIEEHLKSSGASLPEKISNLEAEKQDLKTTDTKTILDLTKQIKRASKALDTYNTFKDAFIERWKALHSEPSGKEFLPDPSNQATKKRESDARKLAEDYKDMEGVYNKLTKTPASQTPDDIKDALGQVRAAWTKLGDAPTDQQKQEFIAAFNKLPSRKETLDSFAEEHQPTIGGAYDRFKEQHASFIKKPSALTRKSPVKEVQKPSNRPLPKAQSLQKQKIAANEIMAAYVSGDRTGIHNAEVQFVNALGLDPDSDEAEEAITEAMGGKHPSQKTRKRKPRKNVKKSLWLYVTC
jgi:hypothetical protein